MNDFDPRLGPEGNGPYRLLRGVREKLVKGFLDDLDHPEAVQRRRLHDILVGARGTAFGLQHDLDRVHTLEDLRQAVPIRDHEGHQPWLDRVAHGERDVLTRERVTMLLETSGTTGRPKHLPVTPSWSRTVADAQALWVLGLIRDFEALRDGAALTVVSPAEHARSPGGLPIGSNTGRMHLAQPWWLRLRYPVPYSAFELTPSELKLYVLLRFALQATITSLTTANPSTILLLCRRLREWAEPLSKDLVDGTLRNGPAAGLEPARRRKLEWRLKKRAPPTDWTPAKIWPLVVLNCWKGGPAPYFVDRLAEAVGAPLPVREVGITASEGFFAIPLGDWDGGVLWTAGHLLEFVGSDGIPRGAWQLEPGERVRLIITTEAGLYRYDLDDVVEVVGHCRRTPVVRFVGKGRRVLSVTGEKVSEAQAAEAVRRAAEILPRPPLGFTVGVEMGEIPRFRVAVELPDHEPDSAPELMRLDLEAAFDRALAGINVEYEGKRESGRIGPPRVVVLSRGAYQRFRAWRVSQGAPEGQVKDPVLALDDREWGNVVSGGRP